MWQLQLQFLGAVLKCLRIKEGSIWKYSPEPQNTQCIENYFWVFTNLFQPHFASPVLWINKQTVCRQCVKWFLAIAAIREWVLLKSFALFSEPERLIFMDLSPVLHQPQESSLACPLMPARFQTCDLDSLSPGDEGGLDGLYNAYVLSKMHVQQTQQLQQPACKTAAGLKGQLMESLVQFFLVRRSENIWWDKWMRSVWQAAHHLIIAQLTFLLLWLLSSTSNFTFYISTALHAHPRSWHVCCMCCFSPSARHFAD